MARWFKRMRRARLNDSGVYGNPDMTFVHRHRFAIFVDGRFWHDPKYAALKQRPHHRVDWAAKARRNRCRDRKVNRRLMQENVIVIRVWDECFSGKVRTQRTLLTLNRIILRAKAGDRWSVSGTRVRVTKRTLE